MKLINTILKYLKNLIIRKVKHFNSYGINKKYNYKNLSFIKDNKMQNIKIYKKL